jgi:ATP-dependent Clp protease ATP-binding subunit ClpA
MLTKELEVTLDIAVKEALKRRHEYVTLEHLLYALLIDEAAVDVLTNCGADLEMLRLSLEEYLANVIEKLPDNVQRMPELTSSFQSIVNYAILQAEGSGQKAVGSTC